MTKQVIKKVLIGVAATAFVVWISSLIFGARTINPYQGKEVLVISDQPVLVKQYVERAKLIVKKLEADKQLNEINAQIGIQDQKIVEQIKVLSTPDTAEQQINKALGL